MEEGKKQRIEFLDYMKAVCVIMVIITHYEWTDKTSPFFTMLINMAVPVFMIVSGYNFAMSNRKKAGGRLGKMYGWSMMKPLLCAGHAAVTCDFSDHLYSGTEKCQGRHCGGRRGESSFRDCSQSF